MVINQTIFDIFMMVKCKCKKITENPFVSVSPTCGTSWYR